MAFESLSFDHIPSIPGLDSVVSTPTSGISDSTKGLVSALQDRTALFENPMVNTISSTNETLTDLQTKLGAIASGSDVNTQISAGEATTFLAGSGFLDVQTSLANLLSHTDRLSGVLRGSGISSPGLEDILSIGKQMNDYVNLLNAGSGCLSIIGGATGLFSQPAVDQKASQIAELIERISRNAANIADCAELLFNIAETVQGIIDKDSQFLQNCVTQLRDAALASVLEFVYSDPCAKFLFENVQNRNPGGILSHLAR